MANTDQRNLFDHFRSTVRSGTQPANTGSQFLWPVPHDPDCRFIVATPATGLDYLVNDCLRTNLIAYYSNTDNLEHRDQSEERASHVKKTDRVTVVDFATRDTVEWKIIYAMRKKIDLATVVLSDPPREWVV